MRRSLATVIERHPVPPLASDLQPMSPLLRRLFGGRPLQARERFAVGTVSAGTVDVSDHPLPPSAMRALADAVVAHGDVAALRLNRCQLGGAALAPLLRLMTTSTVLASVELKANAFSSRDIAALFSAAEHAPALRRLVFAKTPFGADGARAAAAFLAEDPPLTTLNLDEAALSPEGLLALAHALEVHNRRLEHLSLREACLTTEGARAFSSALSNGSSLGALSLRDGKTTDAAASALALGVGDSPSIVHLDVAGHQLGPIGVAALADAAGGHPQLRRLDLGDGRRYSAPPLCGRGAAALGEAVEEEGSALQELSVHCPNDAVALRLVEAVERAKRPFRVHFGSSISVKMRRRAKRLGEGVPRRISR